MKIIPFPGLVKMCEDVSKTDSYKTHFGPINFTCPHCKHIQEARFNDMLFRSIEFYCGGCGQLFKVHNPGLIGSKKQ